MKPLVDGVDHVYVPMTNAAAAFAVLTDRLLLPALWPFTSFGSFSSGGVSVGSMKLEIIEANPLTPWSGAQQPPQIQGIAFRPHAPVDAAYLAELDDRGIAHSAPEHFERDGRPAWTNVYLTDLIGASAGAFVCDYHLPEARDLGRRRRLLAERHGGRMGVLDAVELRIVATDLAAARRRWQRLLDPLPQDGPGCWRPTVGPAITVVPGRSDQVEYLVLAVRSALSSAEGRRAIDQELEGFPVRLVPAGATPPAGAARS